MKRQLEDFWKSGSYGMAPKTKAANSLRVAIENFNSLGIFTGIRKVNTLNNFIHDYNADFLAGSKMQATWTYASKEQKFGNIFSKGQEVRSVVGYNSTEDSGRDQMGGAAIAAI